LYHSQEDAVRAEEEFDRIFIKKDIPDDIEEFCPETDETSIWIVKLMTESGLAPSNGEGRRLVKQGAVSIDGEKVSDPNMEASLDSSFVLKVGKRRFMKIVPKTE
jgi:tyrosyl-tRNA synthetase